MDEIAQHDEIIAVLGSRKTVLRGLDRPSVVFRKVTNGFRSEWGAGVHAGYHSLTSTARLHAHTAIDAVRALVSRQHIADLEAICESTGVERADRRAMRLILH